MGYNNILLGAWHANSNFYPEKPFTEKDEYMKSPLAEVELLKQENDRLQHLTTVLIDHIWKKYPFPLKDIDRQMELYDKENNV